MEVTLITIYVISLLISIISAILTVDRSGELRKTGMSKADMMIIPLFISLIPVINTGIAVFMTVLYIKDKKNKD